VLLILALFAITYSDGVAPILDKHCISCHAPGGIGPMPLTSYEEVRPWAKAIRESVKLRRMPPWFADPAHGKFANDPSLTEHEINTIDKWASEGAKPGQAQPHRPTKPPSRTHDLTITAPKPVIIPAKQTIDYQYLVIPLPFTDERWVTAAEIRPSDRTVVHHAVLYVREPQSGWLRGAPANTPFAPQTTEARREARSTTADILAIYTPGAPAMTCPDGMAKKIPAGSDLVLQLHYTSKKTDAKDQPTIGLTFTREQPTKRILTLQMGRADLLIPPGEPNYRTAVTGTLPSPALLISLFPHMHLRGSAFEYEIVNPNGRIETLLKVKPYRFDWQLEYILKTPRLLPKGTMLRFTGYFDNSPNNPYNPDPTAEVRWGEQSWKEMMIGFFDVGVDPHIDKHSFFTR
jgi:hypothetical protein